MTDTTIQWTDKTWNPVTGCTKVSAGCKNCYAEKVADRFWKDRKFTDVRCHADRLEQPLHWRKPARIFVNSMSDLFHEDVPFEFIDKVFAVMCLSPQHTFQILTKRPERMREYMSEYVTGKRLVGSALAEMNIDSFLNRLAVAHHGFGYRDGKEMKAPYDVPNHVWLGVSVEDQRSVQERVWRLRETPAAVRFISYEPALGPVEINLTGIDWVIIGGESGQNARPFNIQWARDVIAQCETAKVAAFFKQTGSNPQEIAFPKDVSPNEAMHWQHDGWTRIVTDEHPGTHWRKYLRFNDRKGGDMSEWPEDLRIRQYPEVRAFT